ncbi:MAG: hypothetical protein DLM69_12145 [Candidatus Chloroheliales bacterium]|nr:MAG: hypothetical protein DLM69_12145 [Chloroflexota bacterium]
MKSTPDSSSQKSTLRRDLLLGLGLLLGGLLAWTLAYQISRPLYIDIGGPYDAPYLVNYLEQQGGGDSGQATYRWADGYSAIHFPAIGIAPAHVQVQLSAPQKHGLVVQVHVNGVATERITVGDTSSGYSLSVPANLLQAGGDGAGAGDLVLFLQADVAPRPGDNRPVAFQADFARLTFDGSFVIPAPEQLLWLTISLLLLYALLHRLTGWRGATAGAALFILASAALLALARLALTIYTARLAAMLLLAHLALWLCVWLARLGYRRAGVQASAALWRILALLFVAGFVLKLGGLFHPFSFVVDEQFHIAKIMQLAHGDFWQFYFSPELSQSVMPEGDWKTRLLIPYSPFFYMVSAGLAQLPVALNLALYTIATLLDASRVYLVAFIALRFGWSERAAWLAAALATFTPASFLLQQWGNYPTSFSLWLTLLFTALLVAAWPRLDRRALLWLTLLLAVTFVSYTVTAVMLGITLLAFIALGWLLEQRRPTVSNAALGVVAERTAPAAYPALGSPYRKLLLVTIGATLLAMLTFYGQYIVILVRDTIPNMLNTVGSSGSLKPVTQSWPDYIFVSGATLWNYQLWSTYLLGLVGLGRLLRNREGNGDEGVINHAPTENGLVGAQFIAPSPRPASPPNHMGEGDEGVIYHAPTENGLVGAQFIAPSPRPNTTPALNPATARALLLAFTLTGLLFFIANYYVDMAMKQYWWALSAMALTGGWLLDRLWRRLGQRTGAIIVALTLALFAVSSLWLWVYRLLLHNR